MAKSKWARIGQVLKSKKGGFNLKIESDVSLSEGERLIFVTPEDNIAGLVRNKLISQEEADAKLERVPDFVKYLVFQTPNEG